MTSISYLALGDSLTEGIGATSPDHHFVAQYFQHLKRSKLCTMRNFGVSGMTSYELFSFINNPVFFRLLPRHTHISITTGGCDFIEAYQSPEFGIRSLLRTIQTVKIQAREILKLVRKYNSHALIYLLGFYIPVPAYQYGLNKVSFLVQTMNNHYGELCKEYKVNLVNPFPTFLNRLDYFCDEVHPNQQGYDEIAKLFMNCDGTIVH
jgi:lysophospholipase L1-like esterase